MSSVSASSASTATTPRSAASPPTAASLRPVPTPRAARCAQRPLSGRRAAPGPRRRSLRRSRRPSGREDRGAVAQPGRPPVAGRPCGEGRANPRSRARRPRPAPRGSRAPLPAQGAQVWGRPLRATVTPRAGRRPAVAPAGARGRGTHPVAGVGPPSEGASAAAGGIEARRQLATSLPGAPRRRPVGPRSGARSAWATPRRHLDENLTCTDVFDTSVQ